MSPGSCQACRDRHILCDRTQTKCLNCVRSRRECTGYGSRLFWPKQQDGKRAIVSNAYIHTASLPPSGASGLHVINTGFWDFELHHTVSSTSGLLSSSAFADRALQFSSPWQGLDWKPLRRSETDHLLVNHFHEFAGNTLATFIHDPNHRSELTKFIIRLSLINDGPSSIALMQSYLALSHAHKHGGFGSETAKLRDSANRLLEVSVKRNIGLDQIEGAQHIAAGMILGTLEVNTENGSPTSWTWYVSGARALTKILKIDRGSLKGEIVPLLDWTEYQDTMALFSGRHWRGRFYKGSWHQKENSGGSLPTVCAVEKQRNCTGPPLTDGPQIIQVLYDLFDNAPTLSDGGFSSTAAVEEQRRLHHRIDGIDSSASSLSSGITWQELELFKIAASLYLERVASNFSGSSSVLESQASRAFAMISTMKTCELPFAIFIIGCEARSDSNRLLILEALQRTIRARPARSLEHVERMLNAIWSQDDLGCEQVVNYVAKLDAVISASSVLPSLA